MKIFYDNIVFELQKAGGISVYFYEIARRALNAGYDLWFIEQEAAKDNIFRKKLSIPGDRIIRENYLPLAVRRYMPIRVPIDDNSLIHSSYYRVSRQKNIARVVTVHDFAYEYFRKGLPRCVHGLQKKFAIDNADGIICVSENTRNDLLRLNGTVAAKKIRVIYHGAGDAFHRLKDGEELKLPDALRDNIVKDKYILFVGHRGNYKNFAVAVEVLKKLDGYRLIVAGGGPLSKGESIMLENELPGRYTWLGNMESSELNILYNYTYCLLYPSSYEGFGIPILEAMQAGCPVVTTNKASIPEVCGAAGLMVDQIDPDEFLKKILKLENIPFRREIVEAGLRQSQKFSWDRAFSETMEFYKEVYERKIGRE
ncbi:MAG TPA: glycosyltransferase family 1 protein [Syntrophorhabdaceae bacterium]|nr:glycosyltransferase family 1 protein [Syntrophorhabdaceae bacterium]